MKYLTAIIIYAVLLAALASPTAAFNDPGPVGLAAMENFSLLPYLWNGVQMKAQSSYDRTDANVDYLNFLYTDGARKVIFDATGPGCIYRIWMTSLATGKYTLYFEFDDNPALAFSMSYWNNLFDGTVNPFVAPFANPWGVSSGGYYCYYPMQFRTHCRILIDNPGTDWFFYNVNYAAYTDSSAVTTFNKSGSYNNQIAADVWNTSSTPTANPGTTPADPIGNPNSGASTLPIGSTVTLADFTGPGLINSIMIKLPQAIPNDAIGLLLLRDLRIRAYWDSDDSAHPSVDCPLGDFFGSGFCENRVASLPQRMGIGADDAYYCYFPMPFGSNAKIEIYNGSSIAVTNIQWDVIRGVMPDAVDLLSQGKIGYFHAYNKKQTTETGKDHIILQTAGRGCFVGCVVTMLGLNGDQLNFLEGDERIHVDGSLTPAVYGTGTEDFFNCGWYYKFQMVTQPTHGCPYKIPNGTDSGTATVSQYRHLISDKVPYYGCIRVGLEHGNTNDINGNYSSTAFYYQVDNASLVLSDSIDVGSAASEAAHSYTYAGQTGSGLLLMRYSGDDSSLIGDDGRKFTYSASITAGCHFRVAIDPTNIGVKLRRRLNYAQSQQQASVYVDGALAGDWYDPGSAAGRWRDSDFEIPASFTAGKSTINVEIRVNNVNQNWTEYRYTVYSYVNAETTPPPPPDGFAVMGLDSQNRIVWNSPTCPDLKGVLVVFRTDRFPTGPADGTVICDNTEWPGAADTVMHSGLDPSITYYYAAYSYDSGGRFSLPVLVSARPDGAGCGEVKRLPEATPVTLLNKVVTAAPFHDMWFCIQDSDRLAGIRAFGQYAGLVPGDIVDVAGTISAMRNSEGSSVEPMIANAVVSNIRHSDRSKPFAVRGASVGGIAVAPFTPGVINPSGINTTGMLVRLSGTVTEAIAGTKQFYLDDRSKVADGTKAGVLVKSATVNLPAVGDSVIVSGLVVGDVPIGAVASRRTVQMFDSGDMCVSKSARTCFTGVVRDNLGAFVPRATVNAGLHATTAADDGSYVLEVPAGSYAVTASKSGYASQSFPANISAGQTLAPGFGITRLWINRLLNGNCDGGFFNSNWGGWCPTGWGFTWRSGPRSTWSSANGDLFGGSMGYSAMVSITSTGYESGYIQLVTGLTAGTHYRFAAYTYQTSTGTTTWINSNPTGATVTPAAVTSFANVAGQWNYGEVTGTVGSGGSVSVFVWGYRQSGNTSPIYFDDARLEVW